MASIPSSSSRGSRNSSVKNEDNGGRDQNPKWDGLDHLDSPQYIERFKKYEAEYTQYLLGKYFSTKGPNGGNIYDEEVKVGDQIIRASREPCFQSFLDPVVGVEEQPIKGSTPPAETQANISNGKRMGKKN